MKFDQNEIISCRFPIDGTFDLANAALNLKGDSVLDIGVGTGGASIFFAYNGKSVTGIGLDLESYGFSSSLFERFEINIHECSLEELNTAEKYDIIWASHVLEHNLNPGQFLEKCKDLMSTDGWLCVLVPPFKQYVVGGHVNSGWSLGHLMYILLLSGFDIKNGHYIHHGYSLCAFVQKSTDPLPTLRMDNGDIEATAHLWPVEVKQGFDGSIKQVNWFIDFKTLEIDRRDLQLLKAENEKLKKEKQSLITNNEELVGKLREEAQKDRELLEIKNAEIINNVRSEIIRERENIINTSNIIKTIKMAIREGQELSEIKNAEIIEKIRAEIRKESDYLKGQRSLPTASKTTLYALYKRSTLPHKLQFIHRIPIIRKLALFIKYRIFKWDY